MVVPFRMVPLGRTGSDRPEIGMRRKGNWRLHHCWDDFDGVRSHADDCVKPSIQLRFDEYDGGARFDGLERLDLHAATGDASKTPGRATHGSTPW